jgi:cyclopropane fatty-acyl-phospholipid synthase-like methyltransferase
MTVPRIIPVAAAVLLAMPAAGGQDHQQHQAPGQGHEKAHMDRHFDDAEQWAKEFDDPSRDAWQMPAKVIDALGLKPGMAVADIGAGTGYFSSRLARHPSAPTVYAVDIEASMVDYLRQRAAKEGLANLTAVKAGDGTANLPAPVDVILIVDTYHHIPNRVAYFKALRKSLKPGGRLAIVDFRKDAPSGPPAEFRFTPEDVARELSQADFTGTAVHDFLPRQWMAIFELPPQM